MNYFEDALHSKLSTILHGPFGRQPRLVKFYLESVPDLEMASDYELIFWCRRKSRLLTVLLEPPFDAFLPSGRWCLVLTSHFRLRYDPLAYRVVHADVPEGREIPFPLAPDPDRESVTPPTSLIHPFLSEEGSTHVDLSGVRNVHEAYLRLLTLCDALRADSEWSLSIPEGLRLKLRDEVAHPGSRDLLLSKLLG